MFGIKNLFGFNRRTRKNNSSEQNLTAEPMFISDFIGTLERDMNNVSGSVPMEADVTEEELKSSDNNIEEEITTEEVESEIAPVAVDGDTSEEYYINDTNKDYLIEGVDVSESVVSVEPRVVRVDVLSKFKTNIDDSHKKDIDTVIGPYKTFPVTDPLAGDIVYFATDKKYYVVNSDITGTFDQPDSSNFSEFNMSYLLENGGSGDTGGSGVSSIELTGAVTGTGVPDENKIVTIATAVDYTNISNAPTTMPNPERIVISLNGTILRYDGNQEITVNITPDAIGAQVAGQYSPSDHMHYSNKINGLYGYAYTIVDKYEAITSTNTLNQAIGLLEHGIREAKEAIETADYAPKVHKHAWSDLTDVPATFNPASHTHAWSTITDKPSTFTPSAHNQAANTITAMTGYAKASAVAAIAATDTLNVAIGKLEKALDSKQPSGSYAAASHSHAWTAITDKPSTFTPAAHNQASNTITAMTGYAKATAVAAIAVGDTLNVAIGKLEKALDGKAATSHGTHVTYGTAAPKANGTAAVGTSGNVAREDHVHPLQTTVSGNAGTATKLATARGIGISGAVTGAAVSFDGSAAITIATTAIDVSKATAGVLPVARGGTGNATNTSASCSGNAATATKLATARTINGVAFDGTKNITINVDTTSLDSRYLRLSGGTVSGALTVTGQILSNADVVAYSDKRLKTNVNLITDALSKVTKINGYTYDMAGVEPSVKRHSGVIAQELKEILPEAVVEDGNGYLAVRYSGIIPLLIEALKEEKFEREKLEQRLAKIEAMLGI